MPTTCIFFRAGHRNRNRFFCVCYGRRFFFFLETVRLLSMWSRLWRFNRFVWASWWKNQIVGGRRKINNGNNDSNWKQKSRLYGICFYDSNTTNRLRFNIKYWERNKKKTDNCYWFFFFLYRFHWPISFLAVVLKKKWLGQRIRFIIFVIFFLFCLFVC